MNQKMVSFQLRWSRLTELLLQSGVYCSRYRAVFHKVRRLTDKPRRSPVVLLSTNYVEEAGKNSE